MQLRGHRHVDAKVVASRCDRSAHNAAPPTGSPARDARRAEIRGRLDTLAGAAPLLRVDELTAGYGTREVLHGIDLRLGKGQSLCLVGPNGAGKSTILHSIFGLSDIRNGKIEMSGRNVTRLGTNAKLRDAGIACVLQDCSLFPDLTVEQNLWLGGYLMGRRADARHAAERVFDHYPALARRRNDPARALSGGERRLIEISRTLVMEPRLLLVDEPSIGLEPCFSEQIFEMLSDLRSKQGLTLMIVEQNAKKGLAIADIGCVVVGGEIALAGTGAELIGDPTVGRLFKERLSR